MYFKIFFRFVLINIFLSLVFQDGKDYKVQIIDGKWKLDLNYTMDDMKCWNFWALSEHWRWSNQGRVIKPPNNQSCFPQFFHEFFSVEQLEMNTNYSLVQNKYSRVLILSWEKEYLQANRLQTDCISQKFQLHFCE